MKKIMIVLFLFVSVIGAFAFNPPATGGDWLNMSSDQKEIFLSGVIFSFERMDYTITTEINGSPDSNRIKNLISVYSVSPEEILKFLDNFFKSPMNQSMFLWDVLSNYNIYKD